MRNHWKKLGKLHYFSLKPSHFNLGSRSFAFVDTLLFDVVYNVDLLFACLFAKQKQKSAAANSKRDGKPLMSQKTRNRQLLPTYGNNLWIFVPHSITGGHKQLFFLLKKKFLFKNVSKHEESQLGPVCIRITCTSYK